MIIIDNQEFENLGATANNEVAVLLVPATFTLDEMETFIKNANGKFQIDEEEYEGYGYIMSIQKKYEGFETSDEEPKHFDAAYEIYLAATENPLSVLAGNDGISLQQAHQMRKEVEEMASNLPEDAGDDYAWAFPAWAVGVAYKVGDRVSYASLLYKCVQAHTSQADWAPDVAKSLWARTSDPTVEFPEWIQPTGAHDAYAKGDKVSHNSMHWVSTMDGNVWEPGVAGWDQVLTD